MGFVHGDHRRAAKAVYQELRQYDPPARAKQRASKVRWSQGHQLEPPRFHSRHIRDQGNPLYPPGTERTVIGQHPSRVTEWTGGTHAVGGRLTPIASDESITTIHRTSPRSNGLPWAGTRVRSCRPPLYEMRPLTPTPFGYSLPARFRRRVASLLSPWTPLRGAPALPTKGATRARSRPHPRTPRARRPHLAGRNPARSLGRPPHLRPDCPRPVLRPRRRPRPGPPVADGAQPAHGPRPTQ